MSGTGKSTLVAELASRGLLAVDADDPAWSRWHTVEGEPDWVWDEVLMAELLDGAAGRALLVAGCSPGQGRFYGRFEHVVLLSAPADVMLTRIDARSGNGFGKAPEERAKVLRDLAEVEPLLRAGCTLELDGTRPVVELADVLEALLRG